MKATSLYDMIPRKNKSTVFKSAFVHPDVSQVAVENSGGRYEDLYVTESGFHQAAKMILNEVTKHYDEIEKSGLGYVEVIFYSTYFGGHDVRGVHKRSDGTFDII